MNCLCFKSGASHLRSRGVKRRPSIFYVKLLYYPQTQIFRVYIYITFVNGDNKSIICLVGCMLMLKSLIQPMVNCSNPIGLINLIFLFLLLFLCNVSPYNLFLLFLLVSTFLVFLEIILSFYPHFIIYSYYFCFYQCLIFQYFLEIILSFHPHLLCFHPFFIFFFLMCSPFVS